MNRHFECFFNTHFEGSKRIILSILYYLSFKHYFCFKQNISQFSNTSGVLNDNFSILL